MAHYNRRQISSQTKLIAVVVIAVLLIFAIVAAFYTKVGNIFLRQDQGADSDMNTTRVEVTPAATGGPAAPERYLVINDWKVEFEVPVGLDGVKYYKKTGSPYPELSSVDNEFYQFTTQRVESIGGKGDNLCIEPNDRGQTSPRLGGLIRSTGVLPVGSDPLNASPINGYYYYYDMSGSGSLCSKINTDLQQRDLESIQSMLKTIRPVQ